MPKSCEAYNCTEHNLREGQQLSFYTFPSRAKSPVRRDKWLNALRRQLPDGRPWSPTKHLVLCSKHFVTGTLGCISSAADGEEIKWQPDLPEELQSSPISDNLKMETSPVEHVISKIECEPADNVPSGLSIDVASQMESGPSEAAISAAMGSSKDNPCPSAVVRRTNITQYCSALNCTNARKKGENVSYFRFPRDNARSKKWVMNSRRTELLGKSVDELHKNYSLCMEHFEVDQFTSAARKRLIWNAVPTLFNFPSVKRVRKRKRAIAAVANLPDIGTSSEDAKSDSEPHQANTISHAKRSLKQCRKRRNLTNASHTGDDAPNKILFDQIRTDAYKLVVNSQVWHILDDGSDGLTIGILQQHQTFITVRISAEDLTAEIAVLGIPRRAKESLIDRPLIALIDEVAAMSVCPGINDPSVQSLADYPRPEEHCGFFRHIVFNVDGGVMTHSSRILSTTCARLIQPSESICSQCELVFKLLTMSCDT